MTLKRTSAFFIVLFCAFSFSFGQNKTEKQKLKEERKAKKAIEKANKAAFGSLTTATRFAGSIDLDSFVPPVKDSWMISITSTGGIAGGSRLIAAVNSDGNFLCDPQSFDASKFLPNKVFDRLVFLVNNDKVIYNFKALYTKDKTLLFCSDCSREILTITRNEGKKLRHDFYLVGNSLFESPELSEIYEKVLNAASCR